MMRQSDVLNLFGAIIIAPHLNGVSAAVVCLYCLVMSLKSKREET